MIITYLKWLKKIVDFAMMFLNRLSEKSFVLFIQYPLSRLRHSLTDKFYPEIHEVNLWQV